MIKYRLTTILLLCANTLFSQTPHVIIKDIKPAYEDNKFPEVSCPANPKVSEKINTFLQLEYLEHVPGVFKKHPFENVCYVPDASRNHVSFYEWDRLKSPKSVLSISINGEATGAYPEGFTNYHNFDLETGEPIYLQSLLTKVGQAQLLKKLNQKVKKTIQDFLKENNVKTNDKEEQERISEQQRIYKECLGEVDGNSLESYDFSPGRDSITFIRYRCSNHANRALDDLDKYYISYPYGQVKQYLSSYGKKVLLGEKASSGTSSPKGKIFKGKIAGKYPVTAIITDIYSDGSLKMNYWYDKVKTPIELSGKFVNGHFTLVENDYHSEEAQAWIAKANIEADWVDNKKIIGTWTNAKTNAVLKLELDTY